MTKANDLRELNPHEGELVLLLEKESACLTWFKDFFIGGKYISQVHDPQSKEEIYHFSSDDQSILLFEPRYTKNKKAKIPAVMEVPAYKSYAISAHVGKSDIVIALKDHPILNPYATWIEQNF